MLVEKKALSPEVLEAQTAMELPDREMMALVVVPGGLVNVHVGDITVTVDDIGANVCVQAVASNSTVTCEVNQ